MKEINFIYPPGPQNVPASVAAPSAAFRKEVSGVMGAIIFFFIVYLLLLLLSVGLVIGCVYAGISIIIGVPKFITIVAGLGLIGVGVMVFIFLIKFIFAVSRYDRSGIIEVTEAEQPTLFAFIRQLTKDTQTPFPKKIYLSADVNACVFYDSSFWSMFFPVKKNLQIGLGLVNTVNISEFKAVMAHEFGHFSQRSMKLGSFVYNVNKIIHNMLFENKGYGAFLQGWANLDGIFAFFATITARIAQGIQWVLRQMYGLINKKYMSLSREMEFHADAVAASVSGSKSLITALRRLELSNSAYNITLQKCDELFRQKKISGNIYPNHTAVLMQLATEYKLPLLNGLPEVNDEVLKNTNQSRINFKDQWASHPSTEDREKYLSSLGVEATYMTDSAWVLFGNREEVESLLTQKVYENAEKTTEHTIIDKREFETKLQEDMSRYSFPEAYKGFYDNRQIAVVETGIDGADGVSSNKNFDEIFSPESASLHKKISAAAGDIEVAKAIADKRIDTKTFDFDGVKYSRSEALLVAEKLEAEMKQMQNQLEQLDKEAIQYFLQRAGQQSVDKAIQLKQQYVEYFDLRKRAEKYLKMVNDMLDSLHPIYAGETIQVEQINGMIGTLKSTHEIIFKGQLEKWLLEGVFNRAPEFMKKAETFIGANYVYFNDSSFFDNELIELNSLANESWDILNEHLLDKFKAITTTQLQYCNQ